MTTLDPNVFVRAAELIEERGWTGDEAVALGDKKLCIWRAVMNALKEVADADPENFQATDVAAEPYRFAVSAHFGFEPRTNMVNDAPVAPMGEVFRLNDSQPESKGQEWATTNLRQMAEAAAGG